MLSTTTHTSRFLTALFLLLALSVSGVWAQSGTPLQLSPEDQDREYNGPQKNFFFQVEGEKEYRDAGFFGQRLRPYLAGNAQAEEHLNNYRRQKWLYLGERAVLLGAIGVYGQQVLAKDEQQYFNDTQKGAIGVAAVSLLANILINRNTNWHFRRALEAHNANLPSAHAQSWQQVLPTNVGVAALGGRPQLVLRWSLQ
ncbi:hypothetical protein FY528_02735 [Hymenobacter lutimineralis]|uniref:DUF5683 domain-containing protein n=1 Tax=Hymenobacter lutimineralis TaxID=2606448 RepID=A0A5D6VFP7_9BACT|nr:hypothetical protein [Hymenobacter lutimineralis]TYZ13344.1 hypothetical protein FY528_02735 [Hymenobacter lutimineralis]